MTLLVQEGVLTPVSRFEVGGPGGTPAGDPREPSASDPTGFGLWVLLGTISMLFIGFTSAFIFRRISSDWIPIHAPSLLWASTLALSASSGALEIARRRLRRGASHDGVQHWVLLTGLLGGIFVAGQVASWRQLAAQGLFLSANPHSDFFYVLTGVHVVHVLAALIWFAVVLTKVSRRQYVAGTNGLGLFATFWHFLAVLWIYLLFVLFVL
jgi:cytochrome c oxidase subunit 3